MDILTTTQPDVEAGRRISELLAEYSQRDVLLLLSGGSALSVLDHIDTTLCGERVTLSVADERHTQDESISNFSQITKTAFFERARKQHVRLIDPRPTEKEDLVATARRYDLALKEWHITHHDGVVIALLGMGKDGHTAGILPFPDNQGTFEHLFQDRERCVRGYHVDARVSQFQDRMTVTAAYLERHASHIIVFVIGDEKKQTLEDVLQAKEPLHVLPARLLERLPSVTVVTDISPDKIAPKT